MYYDCVIILKQRINKIGNQRVHYHHVKPKHDGGNKNAETIPCTIRDHARIHFIRWLVYKSKMDFAAYKGLIGKTDDMARIINEKRINTIKEKGILFYSVEFQRTQSLKPKKQYYLRENPNLAIKYAYLGGLASGKIWTQAKLESSRKKGKVLGTQFGKIGGIKHQNSKTKDLLSKTIIWKHDTGKIVKTHGFDTVNSIAKALEKAVPGYIKSPQAISAVMRNKEPKRYGWIILDTLNTNSTSNGSPILEIFHEL